MNDPQFTPDIHWGHPARPRKARRNRLLTFLAAITPNRSKRGNA